MGLSLAWGRVVAIAAVQSAITLLWLVYRLYLGDLLEGWGYDSAFTTKSLTIEMLLAVVMEPIFGSWSDQQKQTIGSRGPIIIFGVIATATITVAFPFIAALKLDQAKFLLPIAAIIWALAMTVFRAPVYALLTISASCQGLPLAMSVLTMTGGLVGLLKAPLKPFLLGLGAIPCFILASITLLTSATLLRFFLPPPQPKLEEQDAVQESPPWRSFITIAIITFTLLLGSKILNSNLNDFSSDKIFSLNLLLALVAIPLGWCAQKWSHYPLLFAAIFGYILISMGLSITQFNILIFVLITLGWIVASGFIQNGSLPYIIKLTSARWSGLSIGIYFELMGLVNILFSTQFKKVASPVDIAVGITVLVLAASIVSLSTTRWSECSPE